MAEIAAAGVDLARALLGRPRLRGFPRAYLLLGSLPAFWVFLVLWGANGYFQAMGAPAPSFTPTAPGAKLKV